MRAVVNEVCDAFGVSPDDRCGKEWFEMLFDPNRAASGTTAAMRCGKRLMQVEVHAVEAVISGAGRPNHCVHVRAVAEDEPAGLMDHLANLFDVRLEQTQSRRVRYHEGRDRW